MNNSRYLINCHLFIQFINHRQFRASIGSALTAWHCGSSMGFLMTRTLTQTFKNQLTLISNVGSDRLRLHSPSRSAEAMNFWWLRLRLWLSKSTLTLTLVRTVDSDRLQLRLRNPERSAEGIEFRWLTQTPAFKIDSDSDSTTQVRTVNSDRLHDSDSGALLAAITPGSCKSYVPWRFMALKSIMRLNRTMKHPYWLQEPRKLAHHHWKTWQDID